jgi:hypothetical protein
MRSPTAAATGTALIDILYRLLVARIVNHGVLKRAVSRAGSLLHLNEGFLPGLHPVEVLEVHIAHGLGRIA